MSRKYFGCHEGLIGNSQSDFRPVKPPHGLINPNLSHSRRTVECKPCASPLLSETRDGEKIAFFMSISVPRTKPQ
jgi:hypothetical protein